MCAKKVLRGLRVHQVGLQTLCKTVAFATHILQKSRLTSACTPSISQQDFWKQVYDYEARFLQVCPYMCESNCPFILPHTSESKSVNPLSKSHQAPAAQTHKQTHAQHKSRRHTQHSTCTCIAHQSTNPQADKHKHTTWYPCLLSLLVPYCMLSLPAIGSRLHAISVIWGHRAYGGQTAPI